MKDKSKDTSVTKREDKLPFESPQNEESKRLASGDSASPVERKTNPAKGEGKRRGGNRSVNQG
jgi:hypothetical protein